MSADSNLNAISNMLHAFEQDGNVDVAQYFAPNWVNHDPSLPPLQGLEGAKQLLGLWNAIADRKVTIEDSVCEGDRVAVRFLMTGTHNGTFMGIAPTGNSIRITGTGIFRVVDGRTTDNWVNFDSLGMLQQIGAIPAMQPPK